MTANIDERYLALIRELIRSREQRGLTREQLAALLHLDPVYVQQVEELQIQLGLAHGLDWLRALGHDPHAFLREVGLMAQIPEAAINTNLPALPILGDVRPDPNGCWIRLAWQGQTREVFIGGLPADGYRRLEVEICRIYAQLNNEVGAPKNREAIFQALRHAIDTWPYVNPSDLYHHVVYRLYLREFKKSQADRSWVRAGGEALELFLETHYRPILLPHGVDIRWLVRGADKSAALAQMGISEQVGGSKLDMALYGMFEGRPYIFGGIHLKASLAERVSDDVPCSEAMMAKGFSSYLVTLDAKSFPPPTGDLVNRGELGNPTSPSDKRNYIEQHGSFSACFSYNLRTVPSGPLTASGKKIFASTFAADSDPLPAEIVRAWAEFQRKLVGPR